MGFGLTFLLLVCLIFTLVVTTHRLRAGKGDEYTKYVLMSTVMALIILALGSNGAI